MSVSPKQPAAFVQKTSIQRRITTQAVILATFIIVILSTASFVIARTMLERAVMTQLSSVASASAQSLDQQLADAAERVFLLTWSSDIQMLLLHDKPDATAARLLTVQQRDLPALSGMEIYDGSGKLLSQAGGKIGLPAKAVDIPYRRPVIQGNEWRWYDVFTPVWDDHSHKIGYIALRFDATNFLTTLLSLDTSIGNSAQMQFGFEQSGSLVIVQPSAASVQASVLYLHESDPSVHQLPLSLALGGNEGVVRSQDAHGRDTLVAYLPLSDLGWAMSLQIDRQQALTQIQSLAFSHAMLGVLLVLLSMLLAFPLSKQLTEPLRALTTKVAALRPGNWTLEHTVHSGDEAEVLDRVITDLAVRLRDVYVHQEEEIEERTADLRKQYALDRGILDSIRQGIVTVDPAGRVININPAAERMLQVDAGQAIGGDGTTIIDVRGHEGSDRRALHPLTESLEKNTEVRSPANAHWNIMRPDGTMMPVILAVSPLIEKGKPFGAIVVLQDVTEERKIDYLKSEFITLASHQLRTPLSAIRWYVELFEEEKTSLTDEQQSYLAEIDHGLKRMLALLTALLNASRLEGENLKMDIKEIDASALVRQMTQDCESLAAEAHLTCAFVAPKEPLPMRTDETLLRIVLQNLVGNAVKYSSKEKTIEIGLRKAKDSVIFTVRDHGLGIPDSEQARVFQRFFRAKNVRAMDTDGNGLGLYICKSIVENLGGTIAFESKENEGTTFTVTLPVVYSSDRKES